MKKSQRALVDGKANARPVCPPDKALGTTITVDFTQGASSQFTAAEGTTLTYGSDGAVFTINTETDAPTITSDWYEKLPLYFFFLLKWLQALDELSLSLYVGTYSSGRWISS